jgi:uncharacterized protein YjbI with pentapeptide repeats
VVKRWAAWPGGIRWLVGGIAAVVLTLAIAWALLVPATDWLAHHDVGSVKGPLLLTARDAARGRLLTLGAGLFAAGALIFTALNFSLLRRTSERADQWQRRTYELSEQGQVTDRYTKAIEQLGSDTPDVAIGGIYALERIARDSPRDHPTVMDVLSACIRVHSREQWPTPDADGTTHERSTRPDIQAALTVIGRRNPEHDIRPINISGANLARADLTGANLTGAELNSVDLTEASLRGATLDGANLQGVKLIGANLKDAHLVGADIQPAVATVSRAAAGSSPRLASLFSDLTAVRLIDADLTDANLTFANLTEAFLMGAILRRAVLTNAKLTRADLTRADLDGASLGGADLSGGNFTDANLGGANLTDANLGGANLAHAKLGGADLMGAKLTDVNLTKADLAGANLAGANLDGANPIGANLADALWPPDAVVPVGWQRDTGWGRLKRADTDSSTAATN